MPESSSGFIRSRQPGSGDDGKASKKGDNRLGHGVFLRDQGVGVVMPKPGVGMTGGVVTRVGVVS